MRSTDNILDEDDFFKDTRMSFGDHIESLRTHLWRAIGGLLICLVMGFVLDGIGGSLDMPYIGIGKPLMSIIQEPVRQALEKFYDKRMAKLEVDAKQSGTAANKAVEYQDMPARFSKEELAKLRGKPIEEVPEDGLELTIAMSPLAINKAGEGINKIIRPRELSAMSAQETFVIYFKVSLIAGLVISSPWVFWQIWSFIAAGLYPTEKRYVHTYLPISVGLFIGGVVLCQFVVMPRTVSALLYFNDFLGVTPELRLSEWLTLAILMPLVFGISFQTPLVMLFLERIGIMSVESFKKRRKVAIFVLAVFAMIVTPSPDAITMCYLWLPMCLLYELGIWLCYFSPNRNQRGLEDVDVPSSDELVEV